MVHKKNYRLKRKRPTKRCKVKNDITCYKKGDGYCAPGTPKVVFEKKSFQEWGFTRKRKRKKGGKGKSDQKVDDNSKGGGNKQGKAKTVKAILTTGTTIEIVGSDRAF